MCASPTKSNIYINTPDNAALAKKPNEWKRAMAMKKPTLGKRATTKKKPIKFKRFNINQTQQI